MMQRRKRLESKVGAFLRSFASDLRVGSTPTIGSTTGNGASVEADET